MPRKKIFIHIPKTGGNTLERTPEAMKKCDLVKSGMFRTGYEMEVRGTFAIHGLNNQFQHCRWRDVKENVTRFRDSFAIIRNPWSRVASMYFYAKKLSRQYGMTNETAVDPDISFSDYLDLRHKWGGKPYFWHRTTVGWFDQKDYVTDEDGNLRCDILRFENYDEDTRQYLELSKSIPKRNARSEKIDYKDLYTPKQREEIADWYSEDIEFFGFDFDTGATKNIYFTF